MNLKSPLWRRCYLHLRWYFWVLYGEIKSIIQCININTAINTLILLLNRHTRLEAMDVDLGVSPPPHPPCLLRPCLLRPLALLPPQEDQDSRVSAEGLVSGSSRWWTSMLFINLNKKRDCGIINQVVGERWVELLILQIIIREA